MRAYNGMVQTVSCPRALHMSYSVVLFSHVRNSINVTAVANESGMLAQYRWKMQRRETFTCAPTKPLGTGAVPQKLSLQVCSQGVCKWRRASIEICHGSSQAVIGDSAHAGLCLDSMASMPTLASALLRWATVTEET